MLESARAVFDVITKRKQLAHDYRQTFGTPHGKRVLWDILSKAHIFRSDFIPGKPDVSVFRAGERNLGLQIMDALKLDDLDKISDLAEDVAGE